MPGNKNKYWYLEEYNLLDRICEADVDSFGEGVQTRTLHKNAILRFPEMYNKYVYVLKRGLIKIGVMNEEGKEMIKYLVKPGNLFGEMPLIEGSENPDDYAIALEESVVCFVDTEKLKQWMLTNEDLRIDIQKQISNRLKKVENRVLSLIFKDAQARIEEFIVEFATTLGEKTDQGYVATKYLTDEDIAKLTATSRQTVSRVLNELRDKHVIEYNAEQMMIPHNSPIL